jgi:hypothetical protein
MFMIQHNRKWLEEYVRRPLAATPRNHRYRALLEPEWDEEQFRRNLAWLREGGEPHPAHARELLTWQDYLDWLREGGNPRQAMQSRRLTNWLGYLAFHFHTAQLQGPKRAVLLDTLRAGFRSVAEHITLEGRFVWPNEPGMYWAGSHEHSWRLEPLLLGMLWMGEELPAADKEYCEQALRRAAQWLAENPLLQTNNRGAVWCAVLTLCGLYFDEPEYLALAHRHAVGILSEIVWEDGECGEHTEQYGGGGPDSNYSYTGWAYVYLYRLLSNDDRLDNRLERAARWFTLYNTLSGCPVVDGASVRMRHCDPGNFKDALPMWERLSRREPFFALAAQKALDKIESKARSTPELAHQGAGHIVSPFIWAALENSAARPTAQRPTWHSRHTHIYERPNVQYALVSRAYQTGVTLRGCADEGCNFPLRGMQTFAWGDELPILLHTDEENSSIVAGSANTATGDAQEVHLAREEPTNAGELATLVTRQGVLWTLHAYTPAAVVVVCGAPGEITARWAMNRTFVPEPLLDTTAHRVSFPDRQGRIYYLHGKARLLEEKPGLAMLQVVSPSRNVFAFSDGEFRFNPEGSSDETISFRDASGCYQIDCAAMLNADGNLNRAGLRIERCVERPPENSHV